MGFLGIFFFTYGSTIEQEIVKINTNIITTDILNIIIPSLDKNTKSTLLKDIKYPDMSSEDKDVIDKNNDLIKSAIGVLLPIFIITFIMGGILSYYYNYNYMHILGLNLIILCFIAVTEYSFIHILPEKYIAADTNYVRYITLIKLKEKFMIGN